MKEWFLAFLLVSATTVLADIPLADPSGVRSCDILYEYCLYSDPALNKTTVYKMVNDFEKEKVYTIEAWIRNPLVSIDGRYVVAGYDGLNLVPKDYSPELPILTIFENGTFLKEIRLRDIYRSLSSLHETTSHYDWGFPKRITTTDLTVETHEGDVLIHIPSGEIILPNP